MSRQFPRQLFVPKKMSRQLSSQLWDLNFLQGNSQVNFVSQTFVQGNFGTKNVSRFYCQVNYQTKKTTSRQLLNPGWSIIVSIIGLCKRKIWYRTEPPNGKCCNT